MGAGSWMVLAAVLSGVVIVGIVIRSTHTQRERARAEAAARAADRQRERDATARERFAIVQSAFNALETMEYLATSDIERWRAQHPNAVTLARDPHNADDLPAADSARFRDWCALLTADPGAIRLVNRPFLSRRLAEEEIAFDRVERYPLTGRQREAIVTNEDTTLVIAGAGTGKTSTIVGKVDYLVRRGFARPAHILVLAFARKASDELKVRLARFGDAALADVSTFHALGLRIVSEVDGVRPALSKLATNDRVLKQFIRTQVAGLLADPTGRDLLVQFLATHAVDDAVTKPSTTGSEQIRSERIQGLRALDGTKLKSQEEKQIANWFILNGVAWEYERPYPFPTATAQHRRYEPDFYLPEYDIYLEHFGVDRQNRTAPHVNQAKYVVAMEWKRLLHREKGTHLIETYSWMRQEGGLIPHLERLLSQYGVQRRPLTPEEIAVITAEKNKPFSDFISLIAQFLAVFKGGGADRSSIDVRARSPRDQVFLAIFWQIFDAYERTLARADEIDFNDMINRARSYVQTGRFRSAYEYIVVDEFQDISENRIGLVQDLRQHRPGCRLFVVGDDWQSIYRFTGSDVSLITHLPDRVGATERVDLDVAFRYPQELLDVTSQFVTANPAQLRKSLHAHQGRQGTLPICVVFEMGEPSTNATSMQQNGDGRAETAIDRVFAEIARRADGTSGTIYILGRYHFNEPSNLEELKARGKRSNLEIEFMTAHASKGKEADVVIVMGLDASEYGFPSNVADDPVMELVLSSEESFPFAEERRLFYVAMTRAKKRVYLIAPAINASPFVAEDLVNGALAPYVEVIGEVSSLYRCPACAGKTIRRREGQYGTFWACANFPLCHGKLDTCPKCKSGGLEPVVSGRGPSAFRCTGCGFAPERCPTCGEGVLLERNGRYGVFLGCSRYDGGNGCRYTRDAIRDRN